MSSRAMTMVAAMVFPGACALVDSVGPNQSTHHEIVQGQLRVTLTVSPQVLDPPGTVVAMLTYENLRSETVVLSSAYGCLSFASVYLGEERISFPSTQYACTAAVSYRDLEPDVPLTVQWPLVVRGEGGIDVPAGTYRFVAELNTHAENLEQTFVIQ